jgi:protoheme ferro-lyase
MRHEVLEELEHDCNPRFMPVGEYAYVVCTITMNSARFMTVIVKIQ